MIRFDRTFLLLWASYLVSSVKCFRISPSLLQQNTIRTLTVTFSSPRHETCLHQYTSTMSANAFQNSITELERRRPFLSTASSSMLGFLIADFLAQVFYVEVQPFYVLFNYCSKLRTIYITGTAN